MLRSAILAASASSSLEHLITTAPVSRSVVERFVAGYTPEAALRSAQQLADAGMLITLDHLGEDTQTAEQADAAVRANLQMLELLAGAPGPHGGPLAQQAELSVKLSALGAGLDRELALQGAIAICRAASNAGTTITVDAEDHTTTDRTLAAVTELRKDFPDTGVVLQASLRRTEADCRDFAGPGSRVRLCKGAYNEPESVAWPPGLEVDRGYVRCVNALLAGAGYPMFATHDPRLLSIIDQRVKWYQRTPHSYELQMLYGVRPAEQRALVDAGARVRVYLPYGRQWYPYLMRRMAERPANLAVFLRSLVSAR